MRRRNLLAGLAYLPGSLALTPAFAADDPTWYAGKLKHLIPAASHNRIQIKCSFTESLKETPFLKIGGRKIKGVNTDSARAFFCFDVTDLQPDRVYLLQLVNEHNKTLCDEWPLRTFPSPDANPSDMRLLLYTCAGGHPLMDTGEGPAFLPLDIRQRLLRRALSFSPTAVVANGDHIYWDQRTWLESEHPGRRAISQALYTQVGLLDREALARSGSNEVALKAAAGPQIADLYGVMLRSTPGYFVNDDHDYFENDEATEHFVTLPPARYQIEFARYVRNLYLPEFLPDVSRPLTLSGTGAADRPFGVSESFGTLRYGKLFEACMYDCGRFLSLKGKHGGLVPDEVERWLIARTQDESIAQLIHIPSHPMGWTAGKWREWYPDVADRSNTIPTEVGDGRYALTTDQPKYMWQSGWWKQHQRLFAALTQQRRRPALMFSGDLHASAHGIVEHSGSLQGADNPLHTFLTGPIGTRVGWPSQMRGTAPQVAKHLQMVEVAPVIEKNGFTLLDVTSDAVRVRLFAWREGENPSVIDSLQPYHDTKIAR
ncbi:MAG: hypothetical protein GXP16_15570 [Gammaproteobacteria bacterium]|nr:hypothetical protein [Gammaproteobacteria bacterium]